MDEDNKEKLNHLINTYKGNKAQVNTSEPELKNVNSNYPNSLAMTTDPDLLIAHEIVSLPSKGKFYTNNITELAVEYMTADDEDVLTTPSLIDSGKVLDVLLKRKIKSPGITPGELLQGDRNAVLIFLRSSSYGHIYTVQVTDPRTGKPFEAEVDLTKLKYKEINEEPDENGCFTVEIPMKKKTVKFRLLNYNEDDLMFKRAEARQQEFNEEFSKYGTYKLIASIVSIDGNTDRSYIEKFVFAMPALDALTIRKKINEVSPDVDLTYIFKANDEFEFKANLMIGIDFFFPGI